MDNISISSSPLILPACLPYVHIRQAGRKAGRLDGWYIQILSFSFWVYMRVLVLFRGWGCKLKAGNGEGSFHIYRAIFVQILSTCRMSHMKHNLLLPSPPPPSPRHTPDQLNQEYRKYPHSNRRGAERMTERERERQGQVHELAPAHHPPAPPTNTQPKMIYVVRILYDIYIYKKGCTCLYVFVCILKKNQ